MTTARKRRDRNLPDGFVAMGDNEKISAYYPGMVVRGQRVLDVYHTKPRGIVPGPPQEEANMTAAHKRRQKKGRKRHRCRVCNATESEIKLAVEATIPSLPDPFNPKEGEPSASTVIAGGALISRLVIEYLKENPQ